MPTPLVPQPDPQKMQQRLVAGLAAECHLPLAEMGALYEHERAELAVDAHITKFLHIFATRNVLEVLRQRHLEHLSLPAPAPASPHGQAA